MRRVIIAVLIILFVITGCSSSDTYQEINYYEGTDGINMKFFDNSPPEKVYANQEFPVTVEFANKGAFSLAPAEQLDDLFASATLIYDPFYFEENTFTATAEDVRKFIFLEGKSPYWPTGESRLITLGMLKAKEINRKIVDTDVMVSLCYPYETKLATEVCVDYNPYDDGDTERQQVCRAEKLSFSSQGAPVAVTEVEVQALPVGTREVPVMKKENVLDEEGNVVDVVERYHYELESVIKPVVKMTIHNVGDGQIVRGRRFKQQDSCLKLNEDSLPSNTAVVYATLGGRPLECNPMEPVFMDGMTEVVCTMPDDSLIPTSTSYFDILEVYVEYMYQSRITTHVQIDNSGVQFVPTSEIGSCMDYDGNYEHCRSYGAALGCYYCDSLKKCFSRVDCLQCEDGTSIDDASRRCVGSCPAPSARITPVPNSPEMLLSCTAGSLENANDADRCGCDSISYGFTQDPDECDHTSVYSQVITDLASVSNRKEATITVPGNYLNGEPWYICAIAQTDGNGDPRISIPAKRGFTYGRYNPSGDMSV